MEIENKKTLKEILNEWDLLGVMPYNGGPQDEYDWLGDQIRDMLKNNISVTDLEKYLETQVTGHFGLTLNDTIKKEIKKVSREIIQ